MNQIKRVFISGSLVLSVLALTIPAEAQTSSKTSKRDAAIAKCLEAAKAQTPGAGGGFGASAYRACMKAEGQRP